MKATLIFALAVLCISAVSSSTVEKRHHHEMPKSLQFLSNLPKLLKKQTKGDPIKDCMQCYQDVLSAIESCQGLDGDTNEVILCVESILASSADCIVCICDVIGIIGGADVSACNPAKIMEARAAKGAKELH